MFSIVEPKIDPFGTMMRRLSGVSKRGHKEIDLTYCAGDAGYRHHIADLERSTNEQHDAGGKVGECSLKRQTNGEPGSSNERRKRRDIDAEQSKTAKHDGQQNGPLGRFAVHRE